MNDRMNEWSDGRRRRMEIEIFKSDYCIKWKYNNVAHDLQAVAVYQMFPMHIMNTYDLFIGGKSTQRGRATADAVCKTWPECSIRFDFVFLFFFAKILKSPFRRTAHTCIQIHRLSSLPTLSLLHSLKILWFCRMGKMLIANGERREMKTLYSFVAWNRFVRYFYFSFIFTSFAHPLAAAVAPLIDWRVGVLRRAKLSPSHRRPLSLISFPRTAMRSRCEIQLVPIAWLSIQRRYCVASVLRECVWVLACHCVSVYEWKSVKPSSCIKWKLIVVQHCSRIALTMPRKRKNSSETDVVFYELFFALSLSSSVSGNAKS